MPKRSFTIISKFFPCALKPFTSSAVNWNPTEAILNSLRRRAEDGDSVQRRRATGARLSVLSYFACDFPHGDLRTACGACRGRVDICRQAHLPPLSGLSSPRLLRPRGCARAGPADCVSPRRSCACAGARGAGPYSSFDTSAVQMDWTRATLRVVCIGRPPGGLRTVQTEVRNSRTALCQVTGSAPRPVGPEIVVDVSHS
jgi:hypothetical protein